MLLYNVWDCASANCNLCPFSHLIVRYLSLEWSWWWFHRHFIVTTYKGWVRVVTLLLYRLHLEPIYQLLTHFPLFPSWFGHHSWKVWTRIIRFIHVFLDSVDFPPSSWVLTPLLYFLLFFVCCFSCNFGLMLLGWYFH